MKLKLKDKCPMFRSDEFGKGEPVWFEKGEIFEVIEKRVMRHDTIEYYKVKSEYFTKPMAGYHHPDSFEVVQ